VFVSVRKLHFAPKMNLKINKNLNLYLTENTLCLHYKDQAVNSFTKILFVVRESEGKAIHATCGQNIEFFSVEIRW
jgi:acetone carboxylase gamma subunit